MITWTHPSDMSKPVDLPASFRLLLCALQFIKGDLQSGDLLSYILRRENVDTVMHFAAQVRPLFVPDSHPFFQF